MGAVFRGLRDLRGNVQVRGLSGAGSRPRREGDDRVRHRAEFEENGREARKVSEIDLVDRYMIFP